jgi:class 3 adenylate cyclase
VSDPSDTGAAAGGAQHAQPPSPVQPQPELRIGDAERQAVLDQLRIHCGAGRLSLDEFSERADAVWRATTASQLAPLLADLPAPRPDGAPPTPAAPAAPAAAAAAVPSPVGDPAPVATGGRGRSSVVAIMSGNHVKGRWEVAPKLSALAFWGGVHIDLRQAVIRSAVVEIDAVAIMGGVHIVVPEGIPVEVDGTVVMGGCSNRARSELALPGAPLLRVHAAGLWGGVHVRSKPNPKAGADPDPDDRWERHLDQVDRVVERALDHADRHLERLDRMEHRYGSRPPRPPRPPRPGTHRDAGHRAPDAPPPPGAPPLPWPFPPPAAAGGNGGEVRPDAAPAAPAPAAAEPTSSRVPTDLPEGTLTMLFTDIIGSTAIAERVGDQRWVAVLAHHDRTVRAIVAGHGGAVVKGSGDGYLIVFSSARQAVLAAIAIQRAAVSPDAAGPEGPLPLRAGLHTGEVVQRDGDVFGRNVIAASRIASEAEAGQVLVSALTKQLVESSGDLLFSDGVEVSLRGLAQPWTLHEVRQAGPR